MAHIARIKREIGMVADPVSRGDIKLAVESHFLQRLNENISALDLPALLRVQKRMRLEFINESEASKVTWVCSFVGFVCLLNWGS